jgi:hypothetical protein
VRRACTPDTERSLLGVPERLTRGHRFRLTPPAAPTGTGCATRRRLGSGRGKPAADTVRTGVCPTRNCAYEAKSFNTIDQDAQDEEQVGNYPAHPVHHCPSAFNLFAFRLKIPMERAPQASPSGHCVPRTGKHSADARLAQARRQRAGLRSVSQSSMVGHQALARRQVARLCAGATAVPLAPCTSGGLRGSSCLCAVVRGVLRRVSAEPGDLSPGVSQMHQTRGSRSSG